MFRRPFTAALLLAGAALLPLSAFAATGYIDGSTEMHAGPDFDYPTVSVIDDGAPVEVFGCLEDWSWCDVSFYDDRGWVSGDHLASVYEGRRQPIAYVAPYIGLGILAFSFDSYWDSHYHGRPWYGDRGHWMNYTREHHRASWEGHRGGGWAGRPGDNHGGDHGNDHGGNWRGNDRDHSADAGHNWSGDHGRAEQDAHMNRARENAAVQMRDNPTGVSSGLRGWDRQQRSAEQHGGQGRGEAVQAAQNNVPHAAPQPHQPQAQPQGHPGGGEHHGGDHGGGGHGDDHKDHGDHHD